MIQTCPCCHARYSLDATLQDEAARDLLALRGSLPPRIWNPLIAYLGLFRSETRALAWDKALKLAREIQELGNASGEWEKLETALCETVESLRLRGGKALKNHNYLKRVLENTATLRAPGSGLRVQDFSPQPRTPSGSKAAQSFASLNEWCGDDWLKLSIAHGLSACIAASLKFQPAADIITNAADVWHLSLKKILTIPEVDGYRIMNGFTRLIPTLTDWPQPKQLIELLPPRPQRQAIRHELSADASAEGLNKMREISEKFK